MESEGLERAKVNNVTYACSVHMYQCIKCIFDIGVTFITSFMFVIDDQAADIFCMQHIRNIRTCLYSTFNDGLHHTLDYTLITLAHNCY
jgi:hypothetical protein